MPSFGGTVKLTGESEYRKAISQITNNLNVLSSEMKLVNSQFDKNDKSVANLTSQNEVLNKKVEEQSKKVEKLKEALESAKQETGENSATTQKWQTDLNNAQVELNKLQKQVKENNDELSKHEKVTKNSANSLTEFAAAAIRDIAGIENFGTTFKRDIIENFNNSSLKSGITNVGERLSNFKENVQNVMNGTTSLSDILKNKLIKTADDLSNSTDKNSESMQEFSENEDKAQESSLKLGDIIKANLISDVIKKGISDLANGMKKLGSMFIDVGKQALQSYADYEQLIGGVETLFKNSSNTVQEYANNAYKTAGISANEYMETVTSFSASLLQSLNGDTAKAAGVADMAIIDMADNANKMGTSMSSIQSAYQGFAKQNYTMLDNLKLGYGGTKTEMQRLLKDAEKITGIKYDISNLNDVYSAIHVIQSELGITGTTAKEASTTIQGSVASLKGAWSNMLVGIADDNANFEQLTSNLMDGISTALSNILPRVEVILNGLSNLIVSVADQILPKMIDIGINTIENLVQGITSNISKVTESIGKIVTSILGSITRILPQLVPVAVQIINTLVTSLVSMLPDIVQAGVTIIVELAKGLSQMLPTLIPQMVDAIILIAETLIDNIDMIIDAGIQIIMGLVDGIIEALPRLIDKIPEIIDKLINAITNNLPKILEAGITIIVKLAEGLIKAIPQLVSKLPQIITSIVNGLGKGLGAIGEVGLNLVKGLWNGISNAVGWILDKIKGFGKTILNGIKSIFGIHSPSTLFRDEIGKNLALGIGEGFNNEMGEVTKDMTNAIPSKFDTSVNYNYENQSNNSSFQFDYYKDVFVAAFKEALEGTSMMMDGEKFGEFVINKVGGEVFA